MSQAAALTAVYNMSFENTTQQVYYSLGRRMQGAKWTLYAQTLDVISIIQQMNLCPVGMLVSAVK